RAAHEQGKVAMVWVDETRPVMQGSRFTAWECVREGIPHRLIADVVAASVMARGEVDLIVTGADRIAANGDTANKIGTYSLAVLAAHSPASVRTSGHTLEWDIKPYPFKVYTDLAAIALPRELDPLGTDTLAALADPAPAVSSLGLSQLAAVLYYAAGVTKKRTYQGGGEILFRAAASTGALYQTEVYVAVGEVAGLEPG